MTITFSAFQFIIGETKPILDFFTELNEEPYKTKDNTYKITIEKIDKRFMWIYARYGGSLPYSEDVVDTKTDEIIDNPRKINHVELNKQLFCLYDSKEYNLYLSNSNKKSFLEFYFKETLKKDVSIKRFFKNPKEFVEQINTIEKISFTSKQNVFTVNSGLFDDVEDIFGLGKPENFKVDINYEGKNKTAKFKELFTNMLSKNDNREIHSLVCIGKDDNNIESIFDIGSFTQTQEVIEKKDDTGMYNSDCVKNNLTSKLQGIL